MVKLSDEERRATVLAAARRAMADGRGIGALILREYGCHGNNQDIAADRDWLIATGALAARVRPGRPPAVPGEAEAPARPKTPHGNEKHTWPRLDRTPTAVLPYPSPVADAIRDGKSAMRRLDLWDRFRREEAS